MDDLRSVFDFAVTVIGKYLYTLNSMWLTQVCLFLVVFAFAVQVIVLIRQNK